jgi:amidase
VSVDGVFRLAPTFDTVGWFARDAKLLERIGRVLLPPIERPMVLRQLLIAEDAFEWCAAAVSETLRPVAEQIAVHFDSSKHVTVAKSGLTSWFEAFRRLQGAEIWAEHGEWIRAVNPSLAPSIRERFEWTATITAADVAAAQRVRDEAREQMTQLLGDDAVLCLPTTGVIAPLVNLPNDALAEFRARALSLLCIAGLAGLPQINLPLATLDDCPLGISIVGPHGSDRALLELAVKLAG